MQTTSLDSLTYARFLEQVGTEFTARSIGPERVVFKLKQATTGRAVNSPSQTQFENFSLIFLGPLSPVYPQGTYRMEHASLGAFDLFIVPVGKDTEGVSYQAVFNRTPPK